MRLTQPLTIHQYHHSVRKADAVTNHMLFLQKALEESGVRGSIFAHEIGDAESIAVRPFDPASIWNCDVLIIHHSQGNPKINELLRIEVPKALIYHNITPSLLFLHDPYLSKLAEIGRQQLLQLRPYLTAAFAVSRFNSWELETLGFKRQPVLPLFHLSPQKKTPYRQSPLEFLFVGRITPHKNQALLLKTFFYLRKILTPDILLTLVGTGDPVYRQYLKLLTKALSLEKSVKFVGKVSEEELDTYYERATAFICVSQHEGFCIPLVEAMRWNVPVFARPVAGIPETLRKAGVHLLTQKPHRIAEVVASCVTDPIAAKKILEGQENRLQELRHLQCKERAQKILLDLATALRQRPKQKDYTSAFA